MSDSEMSLWAGVILSLLAFLLLFNLLETDHSNEITLEDHLVEIEQLEEERNESVLKIESKGDRVDFILTERPELNQDLSLKVDDIELSKQYIRDLKHDIERLDIRINNIEQGKEDA